MGPALRRLGVAAALASLILLPAMAEVYVDDWGSPASESAPRVSLDQSRKVQNLKERGNAHYRAKRYAEACRAYREASLLDSNDAGIRNDLGSCFFKVGSKDSALQFTREALRLADRGLAVTPDPLWSFPDLRARKTAYFNLDKLGGPMPEPLPGKCETWSSLANCNGRFHVCVEQGARASEGGTLRWQVLRVALSKSRALFSYDEVEVPAQVPHPELRDMEEMSIEGDPESRQRWVNRDSSVIIPLGDFMETADSTCEGKCGKLETVLSECRVIHFDPCAGLVGVACGIQEGPGRDRIVIGEFYLIPAKQP
ncbi:MAG: hypothetical protein JWP91_4368 [Fibrobacteres bacterium]|nr:hypothetical protein [Fibrobacterota bacterium]